MYVGRLWSVFSPFSNFNNFNKSRDAACCINHKQESLCSRLSQVSDNGFHLTRQEGVAAGLVL